DDLDQSIREIRTTIFALQRPVQGGDLGLRAETLDKAEESGRVLGFTPTVRFVGPVDSVTTTEISDAILSTLQEALSNVARHASATEVEIDIGVNAHHIDVSVRDNGVGMPER